MISKSIRSLDRESLKTLESILDKVPRDDLLATSTNSSQLRYYFHLREFFNKISQAISNYFSGRPLFEGIDTIERDLLEIELEKWLCFYSLLQWGWDYILIEAPIKGWNIRGGPGEVLQLVICNYAEYQFVQHQANHLEFSPRKAREQLTILPMLDGLQERLENGGEIKQADIVLWNRMNKSKQKGEDIKPELIEVLNFCDSVFKKYKNKPRIKNKYSDYLRIQGEFETMIRKRLHPRNKPEGWKIINQDFHTPP